MGVVCQRLPVLVVTILAVLCDIVESIDVDPKGYVTFCPCMGRFGNQADHYLGAISFTHYLDRTLILPPWIEYPYRQASSAQIPFDNYFQVEPLREYLRVVTMETFMKELAPTVWPSGKRIGFCYRFRSETDCQMKEGNPFGPFWNNFQIDFDSYAEYGTLTYLTYLPKVKNSWDTMFPASDHPVLAFAGAPAAFPVAKNDVHLHKYLRWSDSINNAADKFISKELSEGPFLGIHLRHGSDWASACEHLDPKNERHIFASPQCLGYNFEYGHLTPDMCLPPRSLVKKMVKKMVKAIGAKAVFVATDSDAMIKELTKTLKDKVKVVQHLPSEPHIDLAILAKADHYIGNCVSSFSAFAKRERDVYGKPSSFWGFDEIKRSKKNTDEL